ncbi:hypothetical protein RNZ50_15650 [Paracoccaceae bacterium Fryx2]|nr:hypothetical protein [Paracoccaceae bacterium Fryx2]
MEWGTAFAGLVRSGHSLAECLDLTLAQLAALAAGHARIERAEDARLLSAIRVATAGSPAEVRAWLDRRSPATADPGRTDHDGALHCL